MPVGKGDVSGAVWWFGLGGPPKPALVYQLTSGGGSGQGVRQGVREQIWRCFRGPRVSRCEVSQYRMKAEVMAQRGREAHRA